MERPNLLFISIDSLRADAVSALGCSKPTMPFFDELAEDSTLYTNAFTQGIWTVPSHISLFTGLYPTEHRIYDEDAVGDGDARLGDAPTLGECLSADGYEMEAFYRLPWLGSAGVLRGFESEQNIGDQTAGIVDWINKLSSKFPLGRSVIRAIYRGSFRGHVPDEEIVTQAKRKIESTAEPFCFFIHLNDAHWPYSPSTPFHNNFSERSILSLFWNRAYTQTRMFPLKDSSMTLSTEQIEIMRELYLGAVRQTDHSIKSLINSMPDDVLDETVIIIFGDHGEAFGEDGELGHNDVIPSVAHVPLLIRDPTGQLTAERVDQPVQLADIYQTIGSITDVPLPETNTNDLTEEPSSQVVFTHAGDNEDNEFLLEKYGVWRSPSDYLLWNTVTNTVHNQGETAGLEDALEDHIDDLKHVPPTGARELHAETKQRLREFGYLR